MATSTSSIGGLVSGLDTKTLVSQLVSLYAQPQTDLKTRLSTTNAQLTAAQSLNTKTASMTALAKELASASGSAYTSATATSSSTAVTVSTTGTPQASSVSFVVRQLASAGSTLTGPLAATGNARDFSFSYRGEDHAVSAAGDTPAALAAAVNDLGVGVRASVVTDDASGQQRLLLTSSTTGEDTGITTTGLGDDAEAVVVSAGQNAEVKMGATVLSSTSNTFTGLVEGVSITVGAQAVTSGETVTVSTSVSATSLSDKLKGLVASMSSVMSDLAFHTKRPATGTAASATAGGLLAGTTTFRDLKGALLDTVSASGGSSAAVLAGLSVTRDGDVTLDTAAFDALYASDPAKATEVLAAFASAVQVAGKAASDSTSGSVSAYITGNKTSATSLTERISGWDTRITDKTAQLTRQYAALETALSRLQSQSNSLTQALTSLTNSNS